MGAYACIGNIVPLVPPVTLVPHKLKIDRPKIKTQNQKSNIIKIQNQKSKHKNQTKSKTKVPKLVSNLPIFERFCHPIFEHISTKKVAEAAVFIFEVSFYLLS